MTTKMNECRRIVFTKRIIELLPANPKESKSRETEYRDAACQNLTIRVGKNSRRYFQFRYSINKRKYCVSIGEFPAVSVEAARQIANEYKLMIAKGQNPAHEKNKVKSDLSFSKFYSMYYEFILQRIKSAQDQKYRIDHFLKLNPAFGKLPILAITTKDIAMLHVREKERTSASNANHLLSNIRTMMNLAIRWNLIEKNPCNGVPKFFEGPLRERYLSREELPRFLKALAQENDTHSKMAILLLLFTGCRRNEILSMKWGQVRLDEGRLYLPVTKNGRSHTVHLNQKALEVLEELSMIRAGSDRFRNNPYVFPSRKDTKKGYLFDLRKPLQKACTLAGIENFRCHDIRHTYAALCVSNGVSLYAVQRLLNHSDISMTQRYAHLSAIDLQTATQGVAALIDQIAA
jgi:integrase